MPDNINKDVSFLKWSTKNGTFIYCDGRFSKVIRQRDNVWELSDIGKNNTYYLVSDRNGKYAHGDTIKEAKEDLIYKKSNRNKDDYKGIDVNIKMPFGKCIEMYRVITGACSNGVKNFIQSNGIKKSKMSVLDIKKATINQYGHQSFCQFFNI